MEVITSISCALLVVATAELSRASVLIPVDCAPDDLNSRVEIWETDTNKLEIADTRKQHWDFQKRLRSVGENKFELLFGKPSDKVPAGYAIPVFTNSAVGFSGLGYHGGAPRFYTVSDLGGILMYPYGDGKFVSAVLLYLKIDEKFTPVRSPADYRARMDWDLAKLKLLRAWVQQQAKTKGIELRVQQPEQ